jgi:hypothetical protein
MAAGDGRPGDEGDELEAPPWPGMVRLAGGVVRVPACALWAEHESYAAPCWIERQATPIDERNAVAPTVAQLVLALGSGAVTAAAGAEQTSSAITSAGLEGWREPDCAELQLGPHGVAAVRGSLGPQQVRRMAPLDEGRRPWRQLVRPCVPRAGRGDPFPVVCERLGKSSVDEPVLLDRGDMVAQVYEEAGWTLVAAGADDHALCWVPSDALDEWVDDWVGAWLPSDEDDGGAAAELGIAWREGSGVGSEQAPSGWSGQPRPLWTAGPGGGANDPALPGQRGRDRPLSIEAPPAARKLRRGT